MTISRNSIHMYTWKCYLNRGKNQNFMKKGSKSGLYNFFGVIWRFYTKNNPQNSWSPHFIITRLWNQKSQNAGTSWSYIIFFANLPTIFAGISGYMCDIGFYFLWGKNLQCNGCQKVLQILQVHHYSCEHSNQVSLWKNTCTHSAGLCMHFKQDMALNPRQSPRTPLMYDKRPTVLKSWKRKDICPWLWILIS